MIPTVIFLSIWIAISDASWFRWTHNALSDLGIEGISALFFNNGLILGGIFVFIFSIGLTKIFRNKIGAYFLAISSLALIGAGIFPKTIYSLHFVSSVIFFVFLTLALFIIGFSLKKEGIEQNLGIVAIILAMIACSSIFIQNFLKGIAIPEAIVCFPAFIWFMIFGLKMTINPELDNTVLHN
ncbi:hypothetical protein AYK20_06615 [Thermoplasmatales archaeon SG8-52-1]|nr:MAG: hypothetical protein AYK20_06615 [Thermoplasmatales archaeon SG8-52-1]